MWLPTKSYMRVHVNVLRGRYEMSMECMCEWWMLMLHMARVVRVSVLTESWLLLFILSRNFQVLCVYLLNVQLGSGFMVVRQFYSSSSPMRLTASGSLVMCELWYLIKEACVQQAGISNIANNFLIVDVFDYVVLQLGTRHAAESSPVLYALWVVIFVIAILLFLRFVYYLTLKTSQVLGPL